MDKNDSELALKYRATHDIGTRVERWCKNWRMNPVFGERRLQVEAGLKVMWNVQAEARDHQYQQPLLSSMQSHILYPSSFLKVSSTSIYH